MVMYSFDDGKLQEFVTMAFERTVIDLARFSVLGAEEVDVILESYSLIVARKGIFGRAWAKLWNGNEDGVILRLVKLSETEGDFS